MEHQARQRHRTHGIRSQTNMKWPKNKQIAHGMGQAQGVEGGLREALQEEVQLGGEGAENVNVAAENPPTKEAQPQPDVRVC